MNETKTEATIAAAGDAKESAFEAAQLASMHLRDAISAVAMLVHDRWHEGVTADRARNAIDWIAEKMDEECDALHDALDALRKPGAVA